MRRLGLLRNLRYFISSQHASQVRFTIKRNMSADNLNMSEQKSSRIREKYLMRQETNRLITNSAFIQVVGHHTNDFKPALLVNSEGRDHLFNCPEGIGRLGSNGNLKIAYAENIFLTSPIYENIGGLFSHSVGLQDGGSDKMTIHSTADIGDVFQSVDKFLQYHNCMSKTINDIVKNGYRDDSIEVKAIVIDRHKNETNELDGDRESRKRAKTTPSLLAYHCTLPDMLGKLDPKKCSEFKVPVGKLLAKLKHGEDVTLADGTVVRSADVVGPRSPGLKFLVIDCWDKEDVGAIIANPEIDVLRRDSGGEAIGLVIHMAHHSIISDERYQKWLADFDSNCKHMFISNKDQVRSSHVNPCSLQYLLNKLDDQLFPNLHVEPELQKIFDAEIEQNLGASGDSEFLWKLDPKPVLKAELEVPDKIHLTDKGRLLIRPKHFIEHDTTPTYIDIHYWRAKFRPEFDRLFAEYKEKVNQMPEPQDHEPEVVFLGTGSAIPSKYRNSSCILVHINHPEKVSIMLDCGEDSYSQMYSLYGPKTDEILKQLKMIYISHHHLDHQIGLYNVLRERAKLTREPIQILQPHSIDHFIGYMNNTFDDLSDTYVSHDSAQICEQTKTVNRDRIDEFRSRKRQFLKSVPFLNDVQLVRVQHCYQATAVVMKFNIGHEKMQTFTLSYSGDCRPSDDFIMLGDKCDLLIHEATFEDMLLTEAIHRKHCTSSEAIEVSRNMKAKQTILTHFSQRYQKMPFITDEFDDKIGIAFDFMRFRYPSSLARAHEIKPLLRAAFSQDLNATETRSLKKKNRYNIINDVMKLNKSAKESAHSG